MYGVELKYLLFSILIQQMSYQRWWKKIRAEAPEILRVLGAILVVMFVVDHLMKDLYVEVY